MTELSEKILNFIDKNGDFVMECYAELVSVRRDCMNCTSKDMPCLIRFILEEVGLC